MKGSPSLPRLINASIPRELGEYLAESRLVALRVQERTVTPVAAFLSVSILMNPYTASALPDEGPSIVGFAKVSVNV